MDKSRDVRRSSLTTSALIAGISLVIMTILAIFIFPSLQPEPVYITGIAVIIALDGVIALALYVLMKPAGNALAATMSVSRLLYAGVFIHALVNIADLETFYSI